MFHCDEALAVSMLKLPKFAVHDVLHRRNEAKLPPCEAAVDVGGVYDPQTQRFDNHQRTFTGTFDQRDTKLSSAGLVYKTFGRKIIQLLDDVTLDTLHLKVYKNFVEHINGIDNSVEDASAAGDATLTYNYQVSTNLSSRVGYLDPRRNADLSEARVNKQFQQAMYMVIA